MKIKFREAKLCHLDEKVYNEVLEAEKIDIAELKRVNKLIK